MKLVVEHVTTEETIAIVRAQAPRVAGTITPHHLVIIGLLFMAAVIFLPKGLMGLVRPRIERLLGGGPI